MSKAACKEVICEYRMVGEIGAMRQFRRDGLLTDAQEARLFNALDSSVEVFEEVGEEVVAAQ